MGEGQSAFISHASEDAVAAAELCRHLEGAGIRCWIAPRDVTPGSDYGAEIVRGIESCAVFVLLLSRAANDSPFVHREVERAASKGKPLFTVRLEDVNPDAELELFVSSAHWIDAWDGSHEPWTARLARAVRGDCPPERPGDRRTSWAAWLQQRLAIAAVTGGLVLAILIGFWNVDRDDGATAERSQRPPDAGPATEAPVQPKVPVVVPERAPAALPAPPIRTGPADPAEPTLPALAGSEAGESAGPCPARLSGSPDLATPYTCVCGADATRAGVVWGSDFYTEDSSLCQAAVHAGAIPRSGGPVTVERAEGRDLYVGTLRHGVRSSDYGQYPGSIRFAGVATPPEGPGPCPARLSVNPDLPMPFTCICSGEATRVGAVWGSDMYTHDSSLCQAAAHAGAIPRSGGPVTVERAEGLDLYVGTQRNGVGSSDFGPYPVSIRFVGVVPPPEGPGPCPMRMSINTDLPTPFTCVCDARAVRDGTVWGSGPYTADSSLCRAAFHAGVLKAAGGPVTVEFTDGQALYVGSVRNGVTSSDYGEYPLSIRFQ